jgi:DNA invertase Pin-like site-specific DNA recombinase
VVYVRQSTPQQVLDHRESTDRQYALADRAVSLGWTADRVLLIDDDLGKSGRSIEGRPGFQRLLAEVALDRVGLILGLEMSRLARSNADWHRLLELCARFRVLLADAESVFDPTEYSDRLLLGLHGVMNEAELHVLHQRMCQGKLNKARRGELFGRAPVGYIRGPEGRWQIDPDEQVQAVVRLIFDQFDREATLHGLLRYLVHHHIRIPVRDHRKASRGQLRWHRPNRVTLQNLLRHPSYAGAYRYGHRPTDPRKKQPGRPTTGKLICRPEECQVLLRDHLPAYISWERFEVNCRRLDENCQRADTPGSPRGGAALLAGLIRCGRCGRRMSVRYPVKPDRPCYTCTRGTTDYAEPLCQALSDGASLDAFVAEQLLEAVKPAALEASLAAVADLQAQRAQLTRQWQLRLERAAQEVDRAARQYRACEPENRLVGRELERLWEEALKEHRQIQHDYQRWQQSTPSKLTGEEEASIRSLAEDLPGVWTAPSTTGEDRQRIARLLLEQVRVTVVKESERVEVQLHWKGGARSSQTIDRSVMRYSQQSRYPELVRRLTQMCGEHLSAASIALRLNQEGFVPPKRVKRFGANMVRRLISELGLEGREAAGSDTGLSADEYRPGGLAKKLGMGRDTVRRWMKVGWVNVRRDEQGHRIIWADEEELARLRRLRALARTWENKAELARLKVPKKPPG